MNIAIIYHDADFDGKLSNEVCRHWLKILNPDAEIHSYGWDYGRATPIPNQLTPPLYAYEGWVDYDAIYIVDLSVDELMARSELLSRIVWIDHHKSAIEKWDEPLVGTKIPHFAGYRIDGVAACRLCWQWFSKVCPYTLKLGGGGFILSLPTRTDFWAAGFRFLDRKVREPELLRLAGEYDVWDHHDPDAKALQFGLRCCSGSELANLVAGQFAGTSESYGVLQNVIEGGRMVKAYCDKQNAEYSEKYSHTIKWEGLTWCVLNIGQRGNSDLLLGGIKPEHDALFAWRYDPTSVSPVYVSLYHAPGKENHDLSVIATRLAGGGHKGACGFRTSLGELQQILNQ